MRDNLKLLNPIQLNMLNPLYRYLLIWLQVIHKQEENIACAIILNMCKAGLLLKVLAKETVHKKEMHGMLDQQSVNKLMIR